MPRARRAGPPQAGICRRALAPVRVVTEFGFPSSMIEPHKRRKPCSYMSYPTFHCLKRPVLIIATSSSPATKIQPMSSSAPKNTGGERRVSQPGMSVTLIHPSASDSIHSLRGDRSRKKSEEASLRNPLRSGIQRAWYTRRPGLSAGRPREGVHRRTQGLPGSAEVVLRSPV
ncbi:hypothetical protein B0H10DRAFT_1188606 [Mycena sp. CBHHK59/15]|nr:hypothetical protein B0H10DRAFT_1188606 [Mycena sp. CBHHK59/15]